MHITVCKPQPSTFNKKSESAAKGGINSQWVKSSCLEKNAQNFSFLLSKALSHYKILEKCSFTLHRYKMCILIECMEFNQIKNKFNKKIFKKKNNRSVKKYTKTKIIYIKSFKLQYTATYHHSFNNCRTTSIPLRL